MAVKRSGLLGERTICGCGLGKSLLLFISLKLISFWSALKLRYMLPIQMFANEPNSAAVSPAVSPSSRTFSQGSKARECPISFNLKVVAKREEGWEDMLENVLFRWMEKVVDERRAH